MSNEDYKFGRRELEEALGRSRWTIMRWEKEGRLTLPRNTFGWRVFTAKQVEEIKQAFTPNGSGHWHFRSLKT